MELGHPIAHLTDVNPQLIIHIKRLTHNQKICVEINKTLDAYMKKEH